MSIQRWNSNPRPRENESLPITTNLGLPSDLFLAIAHRAFRKIVPCQMFHFTLKFKHLNTLLGDTSNAWSFLQTFGSKRRTSSRRWSTKTRRRLWSLRRRSSRSCWPWSGSLKRRISYHEKSTNIFKFKINDCKLLQVSWICCEQLIKWRKSEDHGKK